MNDDEGVRVDLSDARHHALGARVVRDRDRHVRGRGGLVGIREQLIHGSLEHRDAPQRRDGHHLDVGHRGVVRGHEGDRLGGPGLGEGIRDGGACVADRDGCARDVLRAVQVPGRHIVQAVGQGLLTPERVEQVRRYGGDAAHLDVALGVRGLCPRHEGVRHRDGRALVTRVAPSRKVREHPAQGSRQDRLVGAGQGSGQVVLAPHRQVRQALPHEVGLQVGHRVHESTPGLDRGADRLGVRHHVQRGGQHVGEQPQARGPIVVSRRQDDRRDLRQLAQGATHPRERIHGRNRAVEHVARDEHGVHAALTHQGHQPLDKRVSAVSQGCAVQRAPQVPVGGVQNQHVSSVAEAAYICVRHTRLEDGHLLHARR